VAKIRKLPEALVNRIAAGEVVERPASVVKELAENSLDAQASRVEVELREGGKKLIVVSDNGSGMDREDAVLAVERFATSKISRPEDLHRIETMGFRGEALPSIAAVSRMRILTRPAEAEEGTLVVIEGGETKRVQPVGCPPGTRIEVADLFYNTPARRKFLSSTNTERSHCHDWVLRLAMARPDVAFKISHDNALLLATAGKNDLLAVLAAAYGAAAARQMIPVEFEDDDFSIRGYVSGPRLIRATRQHQFFFVNGRFIRSRSLSHALTQAYGALLPASRQPVCALHLRLPPDEVDPNVHPTKIEVRFAAEGRVHDLMVQAVRTALEQAGLRPMSPSLGLGREATPLRPDRHVVGSRLRVSPIADKLDVREDGLGVHAEPLGLDRRKEPRHWDNRATTKSAAEVTQAAATPRPVALAQIGLRYIVAVAGEELLLVDQHRAAERVLLDKMTAVARPAKQFLAVPVTLELTPRQAAAAAEFNGLLAEMAFELEAFGPMGWILRAVPAGMAYSGPAEAVAELLEELAEWQAPASAELRLENLRAMIACHGAVKSGQRLTHGEMQRLVEDLLATSSPAVCPHGDPIIVTLSVEELDRRFERPARRTTE
jgi:DNA mismatch repair protein MutL